MHSSNFNFWFISLFLQNETKEKSGGSFIYSSQ